MEESPKVNAALEAFEKGQYEKASALLKECLAERETAELWNDCATAELACQRAENAELGYRRSLQIEPDFSPAAVNLGILLLNRGERTEGAALLQSVLPKVGAEERVQIFALLGEEPCEPPAQASPTAAPLRVLVVHEILPEFDRNGSDQRLMQVLREMVSQGHRVTLVARNGANRDRYAYPLEKMGITVFAHDAARIRYLGIDAAPAWKFEDVLQHGEFDLAILYHWYWTGITVPEHYYNEIRRLSPRTVIAVLTEDRHGDREQRLAEVSGRWSDWERAQDFLERELEAYRAADLVLTISEDDRRGLLRKAPDLVTDILPCDAEDLIPDAAGKAPQFAEREGFLYLGNFDNHANRDGLNWFLEHVWPRLRKRLPDARLFLAGNNMPVDFAANVAGVVGIGYVADLEPLFARHRVFVAPVRYGTGVKTKTLNALAHGLPVVTTTVGAEGMSLSHQTDSMIADRPEDFADAALRVYTDSALWDELSRRGPQHVREEFSHARLKQAVGRIAEAARRILPRPWDPRHAWSALRVETNFPEVLSRQPASERTALRIFAHIRLAEALIAQHDPAGARRQLRHVFAFFRDRLPQSPFFKTLFARMEKCYRELGDQDGAARFRQELESAPHSSPAQVAAIPESRKSKPRRSEAKPELSVIIPTYNRAAALASCLDALNRQTLSPERFEVVVVDDGSTDRTGEMLREFSSRFRMDYFRQANGGAGAARRAGVERARGETLLLFNDDTISNPQLLLEHLVVQRAHRADKIAVLGDFRYPPAARRRALTHFLNTQPFLFPQANLPAGMHDKNSYFIACNLSVQRDAVLRAGNFDPAFRVAEDSELGIRLRKAGHRVLYHPAAWAWHEHLEFTIADLLRRARIYGATQLQLLRKHRELLGAGEGPFGRLDVASLGRLREQVGAERGEIAQAVAALEKFDSVDLLPLFSQPSGERTVADDVLELFSQAVPRVFYHTLYDSFLATWDSETLPHDPTRRADTSSRMEARL